MTFYHGTSKELYDEIVKEGVLWGKRGTFMGREISRCTYLAIDYNEARHYGEIILKVEYDPFKNKKENNYIDGCWQVRVYEPIPMSAIERVI